MRKPINSKGTIKSPGNATQIVGICNRQGYLFPLSGFFRAWSQSGHVKIGGQDRFCCLTHEFRPETRPTGYLKNSIVPKQISKQDDHRCKVSTDWFLS